MNAATEVQSRGVLLTTSDQRDYNHVSDAEYQKLRRLANQAFQRRKELSHESQQAYQNGEKELAHELSLKAKEEQEKGDRYNDQAADYVFRTNNLDSESNEIDLHGLFVAEAEEILKKRINSDIAHGQSELHVIVGKGLHSKNGVAKLKPAVTELCRESNLNCHVDPDNAGVLIIKYAGGTINPNWGMSQQPQHQPQPQYNNHQQPHYNNQQNQNQNNGNTGNPLIDGLLQLLCFCIKNYSK